MNAQEVKDKIRTGDIVISNREEYVVISWLSGKEGESGGMRVQKLHPDVVILEPEQISDYIPLPSDTHHMQQEEDWAAGMPSDRAGYFGEF